LDSAKCKILLEHFRALEIFLMLYTTDEYGHESKTILVQRSQLIMRSTIPFPIFCSTGLPMSWGYDRRGRGCKFLERDLFLSNWLIWNERRKSSNREF
jgi:hypothetical protein